MAQVSDLMGLGESPALAGRLGHQTTGTVSTSFVGGVAGTGTAQSGATKILTSVTIAAPTGGNTAYTLPASNTNPPMNKEFYFFNNAASAVTALVYAPGDGSSLAGSTSAAISVAQNKGCQFMCVANSGFSGGAMWVAINSA